ncbi:MAG: restriction endonuclease subunit S [Bacteroidetes bacterium CHB5]|nr:restriction endonuclease subunit S [Bacteroidetes bacterium CHB5]
MKSNYKPIGQHIRLVDERNNGLRVQQLLGLSISKQFIPSVANIIGTDMENYKIIRKNQFACSTMQVRRDKKMPVALLRDVDEAIISQAYPIFEVKNEKELLPEYLMMWFERSEFDREACFHAVGGVRGSLEWEDFESMQLPIPHIDKQHEIVKEYNTIQNRIDLNQQLIQKLEETAQAIYKEWFVEGIDLENLPVGWRVGLLEDLVEFKNGKSKPFESGVYPVYGGNGIIEYVNEYNNENVIPIGRVGAYCGSLYRELGKCWISDNAISAKSKIYCNMFTFYLLKNLKLNERSEGTGQPLITQGILNSIVVPKPKFELIEEFENYALKIFYHKDQIEKENQKLTELKALLLSKMASYEEKKQ